MLRLFLVVTCIVVSFFLIQSPVFADDQSIYDQCINQSSDPPPWCYQEKVEKIGDPKLCENILKHWPKADGVHGWCYYRLAMKTKSCELCNRIKKADMKAMCKKDVCK